MVRFSLSEEFEGEGEPLLDTEDNSEEGEKLPGRTIVTLKCERFHRVKSWRLTEWGVKQIGTQRKKDLPTENHIE